MSAGRTRLTFAFGTTNRIVTSLPARAAETWSGATGSLLSGASGGPFLPHPAATGSATHASATNVRAAARRRVRAAVTGDRTTSKLLKDAARMEDVGCRM